MFLQILKRSCLRSLEITVKEQNSWAIAARAFNASTRQRQDDFEFEATLVCGASPRATGAIQRKPERNKATALCEEGAR